MQSWDTAVPLGGRRLRTLMQVVLLAPPADSAGGLLQLELELENAEGLVLLRHASRAEGRGGDVPASPSRGGVLSFAADDALATVTEQGRRRFEFALGFV